MKKIERENKCPSPLRHLFVKVMCQETYITLAVDPNYSIANLKSKIMVKTGFPVDEQRIVFNGKNLEDDRTVRDYNIQHESILNLVLRVPGRYNRMEVTILTEAMGPVATLAVRPTDSIWELKLKIRDLTDCPPDKQILIFGGKELENKHTISDYNIVNKSVIYLVEKMEVYLVSQLTQERMSLELSPKDTVESVKNEIHAKTKISPYQQVLQFNGRQLDDVHSLNFYDIEDKSTLFLYVAVQIIVRMSTGIDVRLNLLKSSTIKNVKEKIQFSDDIPCDRQYLYFHDELLIDNHTLSDYNIQNESILRCLVKIRIHIKMPNEDEISIDANPDDDVRSVRDRILARVPIPPDQLCLVYNGKKLNNRCTMKHYNLRNGSILYVVKSTGTSVSLLFFELCNFVFKTN